MRLDSTRTCTSLTQILGGAFITGYFPRIRDDSLLQLYSSYPNREIYTVIMSMNPLKALGPDGLQAVFYQKAWTMVGPSVSEYVRCILEGEEMLEPVSEDLVVLIPQVDSPSLITQFQPISLCNVIYKLVTKVLVNKIKHVLGDIVSPNYQGSFISGQQVTDNIIICQEIIHILCQKKGKTRV